VFFLLLERFDSSMFQLGGFRGKRGGDQFIQGFFNLSGCTRPSWNCKFIRVAQFVEFRLFFWQEESTSVRLASWSGIQINKGGGVGGGPLIVWVVGPICAFSLLPACFAR